MDCLKVKIEAVVCLRWVRGCHDFLSRLRLQVYQNDVFVFQSCVCTVGYKARSMTYILPFDSDAKCGHARDYIC